MSTVHGDLMSNDIEWLAAVRFTLTVIKFCTSIPLINFLITRTAKQMGSAA